MTITFGCAAMGIMISMFTYKSKEWSLLFWNISNFGKFGKPPDVEKIVKRTNLLSKLFGYYLITATIAYALNASYEGYKCENRNRENNLKKFCMSVSPIWMPFEVKNLYVRIVFLCFQTIALAEYGICGK